MKLSVQTFRAVGMEARWGRARVGRSSAPCIFVRNPNAASEHQRTTWWLVDRTMWQAMQEKGILEGFDARTLLGHIFSIKA